MLRRVAAAGILALFLVLAGAPMAQGTAPDYIGPIFVGPELEYMPSMIRMQPGRELMVVLERFGDAPYGDFYVVFSNDNGETWSPSQEILPSPLYERHPSLIQLGPASLALFYLVGEAQRSSAVSQYGDPACWGSPHTVLGAEV